MEDIEDLVRDGADLFAQRSRNSVMPRVRHRKMVASEEVREESACENRCTSIIPGTQKIYLKTWGCAHNSSDSEYMAGQLAAYGYKIVDEKSDADVWVLNSCTVKNPAEDHFRNEIKAGREAGKKVVVAGCVSQAAPRSEFLEGLSIIGVQQIDRVVEVVEETLKGNSVRMLSQKKEAGKRKGGASLLLPKVRRNPLIEIISINTGCLNQCTYCKTKHARGELGSYDIEEVVARAQQSFSEGVCEVWLTSEDTGAYGRDIGVSLPELLWQLVEVIPEGCRLRLGMTNPPYILDHLEEMAKIMQHPRVYAFLHVPVQSGSDGVLGDMKREYSIDDFCKVVNFLKDRVPGITIATDIICGFPTETEEDFQETIKLCSKYKFPSLFINQFYPRPGTPAAKMQRIPTKEVKNRTRRLTEVFHSYRPYDHKLGEKQIVLVTEESHDKEHWVGHNKYYEQVLVPKNEDFLGKLVEVEIIETGKHYMRGRPVETSKPISPTMTESLPKGEVSGLVNTQDILGSNKKNQLKEDLAKQERYIILSFILLISALLVKLAWVCFKMLNGNMID
ncbi:threonylcarbamoyladenosine tRNA methylthiotransferase [Procambarus clarkii]|uniref:threonylcarbamoyladenosine tRNA methylthiotransferase n=1 Tax=Procambarus clarkii TaxID=6728 RepID=UPI001E671AA9|nr:threonylcarbamoyladenosine tRNA methylthiotransferase-like [Procambarus clarkii]XP_045622422.1 threonylcarbamoyladenosine tRNA methylthiotransferase-like [Procambarus clarkii]XP_045622423.1 threonylcarbamoyladenosine tRNA methylthiotransferase-like [Procambarus clarkii]XP_045622424.1 threonylcarbamoyladenosine tRNA methylthiotransferase-like [Procambarus clarkii]